MTRAQLIEVLSEMKRFVVQNPKAARQFLVESPQMAQSILQIQVLFGLVRPQDIQSLQLLKPPEPSPPEPQGLNPPLSVPLGTPLGPPLPPVTSLPSFTQQPSLPVPTVSTPPYVTGSYSTSSSTPPPFGGGGGPPVMSIPAGMRDVRSEMVVQPPPTPTPTGPIITPTGPAGIGRGIGGIGRGGPPPSLPPITTTVSTVPRPPVPEGPRFNSIPEMTAAQIARLPSQQQEMLKTVLSLDPREMEKLPPEQRALVTRLQEQMRNLAVAAQQSSV